MKRRQSFSDLNIGVQSEAAASEVERAGKELKLLTKRMRKTNADHKIDPEVAKEQAKLIITLREAATAAQAPEASIRSIRKIEVS
jgi:hypothetical protein